MIAKIEDVEGFVLHHSCDLHRGSSHIRYTINGKFFSKKIFRRRGKGVYININRIPYSISGLFGSIFLPNNARYF